MIIQFRIRGLKANARRCTELQEQLEGLHQLIPLTTAEVRLERRQSADPSIQAYVPLAVAGPDIHATVCDYPLQKAWVKVIKNLKQQIAQRKSKQQARLKGLLFCIRLAGDASPSPRWRVPPRRGRRGSIQRQTKRPCANQGNPAGEQCGSSLVRRHG